MFQLWGWCSRWLLLRLLFVLLPTRYVVYQLCVRLLNLPVCLLHLHIHLMRLLMRQHYCVPQLLRNRVVLSLGICCYHPQRLILGGDWALPSWRAGVLLHDVVVGFVRLHTLKLNDFEFGLYLLLQI